MIIRSLIVSVDSKTDFSFKTDYSGYHEMKLLHWPRCNVRQETQYFIVEPPPELLKPIEEYITKLISEE